MRETGMQTYITACHSGSTCSTGRRLQCYVGRVVRSIPDTIMHNSWLFGLTISIVSTIQLLVTICSKLLACEINQTDNSSCYLKHIG